MERPWLRAVAWLAGLGPFFFLSYNFANGYAARLAHVPSLTFEWERFAPFWAWTILPYWSSDALYGVALLSCRTRGELDRLGLRLLAIQCFSVACFVLFPLRVTFDRPPLSGWTEWLFASLLSFDQPFNQAPSLHVSLAVILWAHYRRLLRSPWSAVLGLWFVLIALSAWTTYQHHFIDLPLGAWAGLLALAAIPERSWPESRRPPLMAAYLTGTVLLTALAFWGRSWCWWLLWPAFSLSLVGSAYWTGDPAWLGKQNGRVPFWMWPYTFGAWCNARIWTRGQAPWQLLAGGVWIGRAPSLGEATDFRTILDLTAELPVTAHAHVPILDLTPPRADQLDAAVAAIERAERPVLVCCALGYSRSATVAAAWLMTNSAAGDAESAVEAVRRARPQIVIRAETVARLREWFRSREKHGS